MDGPHSQPDISALFPANPLPVYPAKPHPEPIYDPRYAGLPSPATKRQARSCPASSGLHLTFQHCQDPVAKPCHLPSVPDALQHAPYLLPYYSLGLHSVLPRSYPFCTDTLKPQLTLSSHLLPFDGYPAFLHPLASGQKDFTHELAQTKPDLTFSPSIGQRDSHDLVPKRSKYLSLPSDDSKHFKKPPLMNVNGDLASPATSRPSSMVTSLRSALPPLAHGGRSPPFGVAAVSDCCPSKPTPATQGNAGDVIDLRKSKRGGQVNGHQTLAYPLTRQNGKIRYDCNVCGKVFGQLSNLKVSPLYDLQQCSLGQKVNRLLRHANLRSTCECIAGSVRSSVRPVIRTSPSWLTCRNTTWSTREKSLMSAR